MPDRFNRAPWNKAAETWDQYVIRAGHYTEHRICTCCMSIIANGEGCHNEQCETCGNGDRAGQFELASIAYPGHLSLGADTDECGHDASSEEHANQCENLGFRQSSCTWCGVYLHGDRYAATFWPAQPEEIS